MSSKSDGNWWEFYGIRYAQGTVVGAMIVYFLFSQNVNLKGMLFTPAEAKDFGIAHLTLLAVYGLTYCYIASAPILVLHAGRGLFFKSKTNPRVFDGVLMRAIALFSIPLAAVLIYGFSYSHGFGDVDAILALVVYSLILGLQILVLVGIFKLRWNEVISYFNEIVQKRAEHEESGYVESYKHLREHGNSFFIVFLQFLLAIPIYVFACKKGIGSEDSIRNLFLLVFIWVIPAACIWGFGNKVENNLQNLPTPKRNSGNTP